MKKRIKELRKRGLALFIVGALLIGAPQFTVFAAEEETDEVDFFVQEDSSTNDVDSSTQDDAPTVNVTVTVDPETGEVDTDVDRSDVFEQVDPETNGEVGYEGKGSTDDETVTAEVEGKVESELGERDTDDQGRVTEESGKVSGEEETVIETTESKDEPDEPDGDGSVSAGNKTTTVGTDIDFNEKNGTFEGSGVLEDLPADIEGLIEELMPKTPPKYEGVEDDLVPDEDGTYTGSFTPENGGAGKVSWKTEEVKDSDGNRNGWRTTEIISTTVEKDFDADDLGWEWKIPEGATVSTDDNGVITVTEEAESEDGSKVTVITIFNPVTGTCSITTEIKRVTTVTFVEEEKGSVEITGVVSGTGSKNGKLSDVTSLGPSDDIQKVGPTNQAGLRYDTKTGKWTYVSGASWLAQHLMEPFSAKMSNNKVDESLRYAETVLRSSIFINSTSEGQLEGQAVIRKMVQKDGSVVYVYCAQHKTPAYTGTDYEMMNVENASYMSEDAAKHVQYIVENGYWGTVSGVGSIEAVKDLLPEKYQNKESRKRLSDGIALAVTQAAIWYYTGGINYKDENGNFIDIFTQCFTRATSGGNYSQTGNLDKDEQELAMALFKALIKEGHTFTEDELKETTDIISQEDIKGTSITINEKLSDEDYMAAIDEAVAEEARKAKEEQARQAKIVRDAYEEKDIYNTDLSLTLAVVPDRINSENMMICIYIDNPNETGDPIQIKSFELTKECIGENGIIIVPNVVLPEGVRITLSLKGTQELTEGAYLFRSDIEYKDSQTMVGYVTKGTREVDLDVSMEFNVTDPTVKKETEVEVTTTVTKNLDWSSSWERSYSYEPNNPPPDPGENPPPEEPPTDPPTDPGENPPPDDPPTDPPTDPGENPPPDDPPTPSEEIPEPPVPLAERSVTVELPDEDVPLAGAPELLDIFDEDVPLAAVPETGDISVLWYVLIIAAGSCLMALKVSEAKKRKNSLAN